MAKLIYSAITSLDGFVADKQGNFDWAAPDEEVHAFVNELERPIGTYLYGRAMYEVMAAWETMDKFMDQPSFIVSGLGAGGRRYQSKGCRPAGGIRRSQQDSHPLFRARPRSSNADHRRCPFHVERL